VTAPVLVNVAGAAARRDPQAVVGAALEAGADGVGFVDSPRLHPDPWLETGRTLAATTAALAGPCTVSLGLRHPSSVAAAVRTLEAHHPGRVLAVVGRGESSVRNEGLRPATTAVHARSLTDLAERLDGTAAGRVLGASSGPRTLAVTAAALGGVLVDVGVDPGAVARAAALARETRPGCRVWLFLRAVVTRTEEEAVTASAPLVGSCATRLVAAPDWYGLDAHDLASARTVAAGHDYTRHGTAGAWTADDVPDDAVAAVRRRFVLTGAPDEIARAAGALAAARPDGIVLAGGLDGVLDRLDQLLPAVRAAAPPRGGDA
jgi:alkanesulfonate monooxygenase SsuD/methylene tetrahydromethanopterin reductase-like flavin-dependent oxidoreductase (luciferase family)